MPAFGSNPFFILAVLIFVAVLLFLEFLYVLWRAQRGPDAVKLKERLRALSAASDKTKQTLHARERLLSELPAFARILGAMPRMHLLDRMILQAGMSVTVSRILMMTAGAAISTWLLITNFLPLPWAPQLLFSVLAACVPIGYVRWKRSKRLRKIEHQLPDALDLMARALRAGHAFSSSLKMAGEELAEPIATEFRTVHDEVNFGVSLPQALSHLSERVPITDLRYFVVAVLIQRESGGNLTEILTNLARLIRERLKLFARIRVLSSEGRLSAWVLGVMPFGLALLLNIVNPDFMSSLWKDPIGISIIQYTLTLMVIGIIILAKIVKIRV
jgi:tight adherence protein B